MSMKRTNVDEPKSGRKKRKTEQNESIESIQEHEEEEFVAFDTIKEH